MKHSVLSFSILAVSAALLDGATISISKDVRFTVGAPQIIFQDPSVIPGVVVSTRDGGRLIGSVGWKPDYTQDSRLLISRLGSTGLNLWSVNIGTNELGETNLAHELMAITETPSGDILVLEHTARVGNPVSRLVKLRLDGQFVREANFGGCGGFSSVVADTNGYNLGGYFTDWQCRGGGAGMLRLSQDFTPQWQRNGPDGSGGISSIKRTADGGFIYAAAVPVVKANADGSIEWVASFQGQWRSGFPGDSLVDIYPLREGGYAILYTSGTLQGGSKTALNYGNTDYWLVRISSTGKKLWDRAYGGSESEIATFLAVAEDGGFIVGGYSQSDSASGNKGVVGTGTWILKLDSRGAKEAEFLIPGNYGTVLPKATGFSLLGPGTNGENAVTSIDLNALRRAGITARSIDARPFNLETSTDLSTWTRLVTGFAGELNLLEAFGGERKFYRVTEP
jgi:hypothetical protein